VIDCPVSWSWRATVVQVQFIGKARNQKDFITIFVPMDIDHQQGDLF